MDNGDRSGAGAGAVGSAGSLGLRVGQAVFSSASLLFMSVGVEFFSYTAFWYECFSASMPSVLVFALLSFSHRSVEGQVDRTCDLVVLCDPSLSPLHGPKS